MAALWEKLLFWKQQKIKEGVTYRFEDRNDITGILLLKEYPGVFYMYNSAKLEEQGEGAVLRFHYSIMNSGEYDEGRLRNDEKFVTMIGDILVHIVNGQVKYEQTRKDNTEKLDLQ